MLTIDEVIKEVSKRTGVDEEIVNVICKHPFMVTVDVMKDETDTRDILFNELLRFKLKRRFLDDKTKPYR
jgi:hypothetical protein